MALEKRKLEPIKHEKARLATFKKRKNSLMKKAWEFTTLCDVEVGMIIYGPKHKGQPSKPETWASEEGNVTNIIKKYKKTTDKGNQRQTTSPLSKFYENIRRKVDLRPTWVRKNNRRLECATWDERFDSFSEDQLKKIIGRLDTQLERTGKKLDMMKDPNVVKKATSETSEDSHVSHNLSHWNEDSHRQRKGKSIAIQEPINFRPNNHLQQAEIPAWMRHNGNKSYQCSGASSSTIPYTPLQGPVNWNLPKGFYIQTTGPSMSIDSSNENAAQGNELSDILKLQPPGQQE